MIRIWILVSAIWIAFIVSMFFIGAPLTQHNLTNAIGRGSIGLVLWWAILYVGFWIARGFRGDGP